MDAPIPGGLGGTFAASPVSCAAALAVLEVMEQENLPTRAEHIGGLITRRLQDLQQRNTSVGEVRGLGAMVAMELVKNRDPHSPDADLTKALVQRAGKHGLVLLSCGIYGNVIRFLVPLTASDAIVNEGMDIMERSLEELQAK
jgi:4-aminobutyrate aminotransferase/(S)-3-amino-2-methylpropionate transaminase